jgi:hypothetical protein
VTKLIRKAIAPAAIAFAGLGLTLAPATVANAHYWGYHILNYNGPDPDYNVYAYTDTNCSSGRLVIAPGTKSGSHSYDSFRMTGSAFRVYFYDGETGASKGYQDYLAGTCKVAYDVTDYRVVDF